MNYGVYKETYAGREAYRYRIVDGADQVCYLAEPTGLSLPLPTRLVTFFDPDHNPVARLEPSPRLSGQLSGTYSLFLDDQEESQAVLGEKWSLVDLILLRLPYYVIHIGGRAYVALGNRYGERLYEIFIPADEELFDSKDEPEEVVVLDDSEEPEQAETPEPVGQDLDDAEIEQSLPQEEDPRRGELVGEVSCPTSGPNYIVDAEAAPLRQSPLALASLVIIIDMHLSGVSL